MDGEHGRLRRRHKCVTPHVAQNDKGRRQAIDGRTTRHARYAQSQRRRKLIEEAFGWAKTIGGLARPMRRGLARMGFAFTFTVGRLRSRPSAAAHRRANCVCRSRMSL